MVRSRRCLSSFASSKHPRTVLAEFTFLTRSVNRRTRSDREFGSSPACAPDLGVVLGESHDTQRCEDHGHSDGEETLAVR